MLLFAIYILIAIAYEMTASVLLVTRTSFFFVDMKLSCLFIHLNLWIHMIHMVHMGDLM